MKSGLFRNSELTAIPFIDFWGLCLDDKKDYLHIIKKKQHSSLDYDIDIVYSNIVNKEFKPEKLKDLFEVTNYVYSIIEGHHHYDMEINDIPVYINFYRIQYGDYTCEMKPNTINDFLTLCQLAEVEIKWRLK